MIGFRRLAGAVTLIVSALVAPRVDAVHDVVVDDVPQWASPRVIDGRVYAFDQHGDYLYVGGSFTTIRNPQSDAPQLSQQAVFRFNMATRTIDENWRPQIDGSVEGLVVSPDGNSVYLGGSFLTVNGVSKSRLVKLSTADGSIVTAFKAKAGGTVKDIALTDSTLIVGGHFSALNGQQIAKLGAVDPTTGTPLTGFDTDLTGPRDDGGAYVQDFDVSSDQRWLVVGGNFTQAAGQYREQVAVFALDGSSATLAPWSTTRFAYDCASVYESTWIRGISISPDDRFFVINTTGAHFGATKLCDTATRWELPVDGPRVDATETWTSHTGGDTHWEALVTEAAVYVGGHQRWENNPFPSPGGDNDGPGSVVRLGIAALDPLTGVPLSWDPGRDRGRGIEAFLATDDYLFVGSDTNIFNGLVRQKVAILSTEGGTPNPPPDTIDVPVDVQYAVGSSLYSAAFDGTSFSTPTRISGPDIDGNDWTTVRDGFVQHGQLVYFGPSGAYFRRPFDGSTFGTPTNLSTSVGYIDATHDLTPYDQPYNVAEIRDATYANGRIYYTRTNDSRLWWRYYSLESGIIGSLEYVSSSTDFSGATAIDVAGQSMYLAWQDGKLYRAPISNGTVSGSPSTWTVVDSGQSGINWSQVTTIFSTNAD